MTRARAIELLACFTLFRDTHTDMGFCTALETYVQDPMNEISSTEAHRFIGAAKKYWEKGKGVGEEWSGVEEELNSFVSIIQQE